MSDAAILRFRALVEAGLAALEERREEINDLNVFPVADGDTGDNMVLTLRAVRDELDRILREAGPSTLDEIGREEIVQSVARAALLGARGNSGVILSQLIRGAAQELISRPGELIDPVLIGAALAGAADQAYGSVRNPTEGTILTVVREMASRVATELPRMPQPRLGVDATPAVQDALAAAVMAQALEAGERSVKRGPDLLPVLREAGVVDAGGYGLTVVLAGMVQALRGGEPLALDHHAPARITHPEHASTSFRYCTNFAVTGAGLDQRHYAEALDQIGDSVLVVGDSSTLKVHVHTDSPERAMALFKPHALSRIDVADMREQVSQRDARLAIPGSVYAPVAPEGEPGVCALLAVATGEGFRALFLSLGATVLDGGATLNPSTSELLAAIHAVGAEDVVLLPNSANVQLAAERAAELSEKQVVVVPTRSLQAGLAAAVGLDPGRDAVANAEAMRAVIAAVRTGAVAPAAREDPGGRFGAGDALGFVDDELVAWGEPPVVLGAVLGRLAQGAELVTCLRGIGAPLADGEVRALADGEVQLELAFGGQSSYWWLLSAE
jgi:DAK2 domain fusion protein YloV